MDITRSVLVLAASSALLGLVAYDMRKIGSQAWRPALLDAFVILGACVWIITETLGAFRALALPTLLVAWGLVSATAVVVAFRPMEVSARKAMADEFAEFVRAIRALPGASIAAVTFGVASAGLLAIIAFTAAPNTWDSMTYHLSRVMHWQQNHSLAFYATSVQRQLSFGPLAEMTILNFQILAGTDRLANFVQWFAMLGCAIGVSLIAKRLGGTSSMQFVAATATITLPMAVLQATSTQNDLVVTLWCVCFTALGLEHLDGKPSTPKSVLAGAALGLAVLTKVTAMLYLAPIGAWLAIDLVRRLSVRAWAPLAAVLGVAVIIMAPHALRNIDLFGTPLGPTTGQEIGGELNEVRSLPELTSNIVRNLGMQLALPIDGVNTVLQGVLQRVHAGIGIGISDPRTTWRQSQFQVVFSAYEDSAGNPLHLVFLIMAPVLLLWSRPRRPLIYLLSLVLGFMLFCLLLKWQPWNSRLIMPSLVLGLPLAAVAWGDHLASRKALLPALILAVGAIPYLIFNPTRPVVGADSILLKDRLQQYFTNVPDSFASYEAAAEIIHDSGCTRIGLATTPEGREYLIWATNAVYGRSLQIEHILVKNVSRRISTDFDPCAIIVTYPVQELTMTYQDRAYDRRIDTERFSLYLAAGSTP